MFLVLKMFYCLGRLAIVVGNNFYPSETNILAVESSYQSVLFAL